MRDRIHGTVCCCRIFSSAASRSLGRASTRTASPAFLRASLAHGSTTMGRPPSVAVRACGQGVRRAVVLVVVLPTVSERAPACSRRLEAAGPPLSRLCRWAPSSPAVMSCTCCAMQGLDVCSHWRCRRCRFRSSCAGAHAEQAGAWSLCTLSRDLSALASRRTPTMFLCRTTRCAL